MKMDIIDCIGPGVYVIQSGDLFKIGLTKDLKSRLIALQIGSTNKLEIVKWLPRHTFREAKALERELHRKFDAVFIRGEWFKLTSENLLDIEVYDYYIPENKIEEEIDIIKYEYKPSISGKAAKSFSKSYHPDWYFWNWG